MRAMFLLKSKVTHHIDGLCPTVLALRRGAYYCSVCSRSKGYTNSFTRSTVADNEVPLYSPYKGSDDDHV